MMFNIARTEKGHHEGDLFTVLIESLLWRPGIRNMSIFLFPPKKVKSIRRSFAVFECVTQNTKKTGKYSTQGKPPETSGKTCKCEGSPGRAAVGGYCAGDSLPHIRAGQCEPWATKTPDRIVPITIGLIDSYCLNKGEL